MFKFALGGKLKDTVTGFVGVAIARDEWTNGCRRYGLQAPMDKDGKVPDLRWVEEMDLEVVLAAPVTSPETRRRGGPQSPNPSPMAK